MKIRDLMEGVFQGNLLVVDLGFRGFIDGEIFGDRGLFGIFEIILDK